MAPVLRQGWTVKDPNQSADVFTANVPTKFSDGTAANAFTGAEVVVNTRISNGNYDVYERGLAGVGQGNIIYSFNASNSKIDIKNQAAYDRFFDNSTPAGKKNLDTLNKQIKTATYDIAQLNSGTDPLRNTDFNNLKKTDAYKSLANQQKPGQRLANAVAEPGGDPTGGASETPGGRNFDDDIKGSANTRNTFPQNLIYPLKLAETKQDVIKFKMVKFRPRKFETTSTNLGGVAPRTTGQIIGVVVLPIPNGISDSNTVNWNSGDMNAFDAFAANLALTGIKDGFGAGAQLIQKTGDGLSNNAGEVGGGLASAFAGLAIGQGGAQILQRTEGAILNPNMELLFNGPSLRPFTFSFKLASRSEKESETIRSIIRFFKQGSAAQKSQSNLFLRAPHTFQIEYLHQGKPHNFLNQFKECALQSFGVSYTPEGQYATFQDGAMVSYQITMQFQELEPIFNEDYEGGIGDKATDTEIGY
jgi:hypothetical protein